MALWWRARQRAPRLVPARAPAAWGGGAEGFARDLEHPRERAATAGSERVGQQEQSVEEIWAAAALLGEAVGRLRQRGAASGATAASADAEHDAAAQAAAALQAALALGEPTAPTARNVQAVRVPSGARSLPDPLAGLAARAAPDLAREPTPRTACAATSPDEPREHDERANPAERAGRTDDAPSARDASVAHAAELGAGAAGDRGGCVDAAARAAAAERDAAAAPGSGVARATGSCARGDDAPDFDVSGPDLFVLSDDELARPIAAAIDGDAAAARAATPPVVAGGGVAAVPSLARTRDARLETVVVHLSGRGCGQAALALLAEEPRVLRRPPPACVDTEAGAALHFHVVPELGAGERALLVQRLRDVARTGA